MTGFKPRTSGIGSDHSTNWATTTARITLILFPVISNNRQKLLFKNCHRLDSNLIPLRRNVCSRKILVEYTAKFPFTCQPYKKHILYKSPSKVCLRSRMRERERERERERWDRLTLKVSKGVVGWNEPRRFR